MLFRSSGRPDTLKQNGWTVRYVAWQETPEGTVTPSAQSAQSAQPRRIDMARDGNDAPLSVRLVIDPKSEQ